jgi:predicted DNA-binding ribbon-helix-helix protein
MHNKDVDSVYHIDFYDKFFVSKKSCLTYACISFYMSLHTARSLLKQRKNTMLAKDNTYDNLRSTLVSRNVTINGKRTSVRLEPEMWSALTEICQREKATIHKVCSSIAMRKDPNTSLTAAIRVFIMAYFRVAATEDGHMRAQHGGTMLGYATQQRAELSTQRSTHDFISAAAPQKGYPNHASGMVNRNFGSVDRRVAGDR